MKVICINAKANKQNGWTELVEGNVYDVSFTKNHCGVDCYLIHGDYLPTICNCGFIESGAIYKGERFIPLSDIDETEMVREKLEIQVL